jgi:hypothetical protein
VCARKHVYTYSLNTCTHVYLKSACAYRYKHSACTHRCIHLHSTYIHTQAYTFIRPQTHSHHPRGVISQTVHTSYIHSHTLIQTCVHTHTSTQTQSPSSRCDFTDCTYIIHTHTPKNMRTHTYIYGQRAHTWNASCKVSRHSIVMS